MKNYVLDINILIHIVRDSKHWRKINDLYDPFRHVSHISFAAVAEAVSFAKRMSWRGRKIESLKSVVRSFDVLHSDDGLIEDYIEIDVFSQGKHPTLKLPEDVSARNMGKNDIWIAATTKSIEGAELITTDRDFEHLDGVFFKVNYVGVV